MNYFKKSSYYVGILIALIFSFQCRYLFAETYTDDLGRKVKIKPSPQRIVSLAPHITEILFAIGLKEQVVGVTQFSDYPDEAKSRAIVGSYINLNLEKIVALKPDLIISTSDGNPKENIDRLTSTGLPVFVISPLEDIDAIIGSILTIGRISMREIEAERLVHTMKGRIGNVMSRLKGVRPRSVFYQLGDNPLMTAGENTFINSLIEMAGGRNIAGGHKVRYPRFSMEEVLASSPEVIIISSMADKTVSDKALKKWERWKDIQAVKNGEIHFINPDLIHRPGPRIVEGFEGLARMIHPERFPL
ncbi:MAG: cobalamin-binding protein [Thermodesulfobacteriota bacterium]